MRSNAEGDTAPEWLPGRLGYPVARRGLRLVRGLGVLSVFGFAFAFGDFILRDALPTCVFRIVLGIQCSFCGMSRAFALAADGRWEEAFRMNLLWPFAAALMMVVAAADLGDALGIGRPADRLVARLTARWKVWTGALIVFMAMRNL